MTQCARDTTCTRPPVRRGMCGAHYEQWRTRQHAYGRFKSLYVDAEPARLHVKELQARGLGLRRIAQLAGLNRKILQYLMSGRPDRGTGPCQEVTAETASKILAVELPARPHSDNAAHQPVPAVGTIRRLQALVAFGYPRSYLASRLDIQPGNATRLFDDSTTHVLAITARRVEALFGELQLTPGPGIRARNEGRRRGWPLPMQWDEDCIDDAGSEADRSRRRRGYDPAHDPELIAERQERVTAMTRQGLSASEIAVQLGVTGRTVVRDRAIQLEAAAS
jgi:hypothetical protein